MSKLFILYTDGVILLILIVVYTNLSSIVLCLKIPGCYQQLWRFAAPLICNWHVSFILANSVYANFFEHIEIAAIEEKF